MTNEKGEGLFLLKKNKKVLLYTYKIFILNKVFRVFYKSLFCELKSLYSEYTLMYIRYILQYICVYISRNVQVYITVLRRIYKKYKEIRRDISKRRLYSTRCKIRSSYRDTVKITDI